MMTTQPDSPRLQTLLKNAAADSSNTFTWYGLAMEYKSLGRVEEAVRTFRELLVRDPKYVPAYHMLARLLMAENRIDEAKDVFQAGITVATEVGNGHAAGEMEEALNSLE
jgi:Tfp pilus assembly protein PilF